MSLKIKVSALLIFVAIVTVSYISFGSEYVSKGSFKISKDSLKVANMEGVDSGRGYKISSEELNKSKSILIVLKPTDCHSCISRPNLANNLKSFASNYNVKTYGISFSTSVSEIEGYLNLTGIDIPFVVLKKKNMSEYGLDENSPYIMLHEGGKVIYVSSISAGIQKGRELIGKLKRKIRKRYKVDKKKEDT